VQGQCERRRAVKRCRSGDADSNGCSIECDVPADADSGTTGMNDAMVSFEEEEEEEGRALYSFSPCSALFDSPLAVLPHATCDSEWSFLRLDCGTPSLSPSFFDGLDIDVDMSCFDEPVVFQTPIMLW
jgi:hypothetical protein